MPPTEKQRERRGLFGRKKKKERVDADTSYNTKSDGDSLSSGRSKDDRKRKGGLGQKIRRLVGGRKKSKRTGDEVSTVEVYDPNVRTPQQGLDPDLLANVLSRDETNPSQDPHIVAGRFGAIDEAGEEEEDEEDDDEEEERTMDSGEMLYGADGERDDISEQGELVGPLEIVLVLVDPQSLRFELLQLEFETPQLSRVSECLEQVEDIVTETALKSLEFHSVLDRQGNSFPAKVSLGKALTCRRRGKDILVGISKDVTPDEAGRLARPILGDAKVIQMVRSLLEGTMHSVAAAGGVVVSGILTQLLEKSRFCLYVCLFFLLRPVPKQKLNIHYI